VPIESVEKIPGLYTSGQLLRDFLRYLTRYKIRFLVEEEL